MLRYSNGIKNIDYGNLVSSPYSGHSGLSSTITYTIEDTSITSNLDKVEESASVERVFDDYSDNELYHVLQDGSFLVLKDDPFNKVLKLISGQYEEYGSITHNLNSKISLSPNGRYLLEVRSGGGIYVYDFEEGPDEYVEIRNTTFSFLSGSSHVDFLAISSTGIVCILGNDRLFVYDSVNDSEVHIEFFSAFDEEVDILVASGNDSFVFTKTDGTTIQVYNIYFLTGYGNWWAEAFTVSIDPGSTDLKLRYKNFSLYVGYMSVGVYHLKQNDIEIDVFPYLTSGTQVLDFNTDMTLLTKLGSVYRYGSEQIIESTSILNVDSTNLITYNNSIGRINYRSKSDIYKIGKLSGTNVSFTNDVVVGFIPQYSESRDFFRKSIPISTNNKTDIRFSLRFESGPAIQNKNYVTTGDTIGGLIEYEESLVSNKMKFRVITDKNVVLYQTENYNGLINLSVPANTDTVILETFDLSTHRYAKYSQPVLNISNVRVYDYTTPSIGILNNTKISNEHTYLTSIKLSALDIDLPTDGFYDIILDKKDKNYFTVGDKYYNINYRPLNTKRNACLEFESLNYSDVDEDYPIELLIDVVGLDTQYAQNYYNNLGLIKTEVDSYYKNGGKIGIRPLVSTGSFPTTVQQVNSGDNGVYATPYDVTNFKCGLQIYDITQAVQSSILAGKSNILVWLFYDKLHARDNYINFKVGREQFNQPRIRYRKKNG